MKLIGCKYMCNQLVSQIYFQFFFKRFCEQARIATRNKKCPANAGYRFVCGEAGQ